VAYTPTTGKAGTGKPGTGKAGTGKAGTSRKGSPRNWAKKTWARVIIGLLVVVYVVLFIVLNSTSVKIDFVFFSVRSRLWIGFLVCLVLGGGLGAAFAAYRQRSGRADKPSAG
jgi:uncharacterized integral membrane protein